jgi:DNA excision repair protein ERCC-2
MAEEERSGTNNARDPPTAQETSILFPHERMREVQNDFVSLVNDCVQNKKHCVLHAPTGLGKTAASISPALSYALKHDLAVIFCTPRHTQHLIAQRTAADIRNRHGVNFCCVTIVGKRHLCAHDGIEGMRSDDFSAYCKAVREAGQCAHFIRSRSGQNASMEVKAIIQDIEAQGPIDIPSLLETGREKRLCPYELSLHAASRAKLIITDYHYLFHAPIREKFLGRIGKKPEQLIVIVDEGHNLAGRVRESLTHRLTSATLKRAVNEAKAFGQHDVVNQLIEMDGTLEKLGRDLGPLGKSSERLVSAQEWDAPLAALGDIDELDDALVKAVEVVQLSNRKHSPLATVMGFCRAWRESEGDAFVRILRRTDRGLVLSLRCLDPAVGSAAFIKQTHSTILMSGTLRPTRMFVQQLGFPENTAEKEFSSPFPSHNRLCVIVPGVTTKFSKRDERQYDAIAKHCASIIDATPGCCALYFPSYALRDIIAARMETACTKTIFREDASMTPDQRKGFLARFASYKDAGGAALLGVASGSFGEGIDLPGVLKAVVVVGVPLEHPDLETQQLIAYYDRRFGKGWDYGYVLPALMRTMQNAGRAIRSETDRGVLIFMDERYGWPSYSRCFPDYWSLRTSADPAGLIRRFFSTTGGNPPA